VTLLPSVREQLEDAATRRARPAHTRRPSASWRPWAGRTALALASLAALTVALAGMLGRASPGGVNASPGGVNASQVPAGAQLGTMGARLKQIAYVQTSDAPAGIWLSSVRARSLPTAGGGYEIAVSFTPRVSFAGSQDGYSVSVSGPLGLAGQSGVDVYTTPVSGAQAGVPSARSVSAPAGERLRPGVYRGTVAVVYAERPALLEDSETVYRPVGSFHVRVP
jgi:hypothetical protein